MMAIRFAVEHLWTFGGTETGSCEAAVDTEKSPRRAVLETSTTQMNLLRVCIVVADRERCYLRRGWTRGDELGRPGHTAVASDTKEDTGKV